VNGLPATYSGMPMGQLWDLIRRLVAEVNYVVGDHASERLEEGGIMEWQAVVGLEDGELIAERPVASPNPAVEVKETCRTGLSSRPYGRICRRAVSPNW
jgi:hypothetical protein